MHAYIKLILNRNRPLSIIESTELCAISKFSSTIGVPKLSSVILELVKLVEQRVKDELVRTVGAVIYDGWTCNNMHFTGVIASYCTTHSSSHGQNQKQVTVPRLTSLAVAPMGTVDADDNDSRETTTFAATAYIKFLRDTFEIFGSNFDEWCPDLIGDNTCTNRKIADETKNHVWVACPINSIWKYDTCLKTIMISETLCIPYTIRGERLKEA